MQTELSFKCNQFTRFIAEKADGIDEKAQIKTVEAGTPEFDELQRDNLAIDFLKKNAIV